MRLEIPTGSWWHTLRHKKDVLPSLKFGGGNFLNSVSNPTTSCLLLLNSTESQNQWAFGLRAILRGNGTCSRGPHQRRNRIPSHNLIQVLYFHEFLLLRFTFQSPALFEAL